MSLFSCLHHQVETKGGVWKALGKNKGSPNILFVAETDRRDMTSLPVFLLPNSLACQERKHLGVSISCWHLRDASYSPCMKNTRHWQLFEWISTRLQFICWNFPSGKKRLTGQNWGWILGWWCHESYCFIGPSKPSLESLSGLYWYISFLLYSCQTIDWKERNKD